MLCVVFIELSNYLILHRYYIYVGTSVGNTSVCSGLDVIYAIKISLSALGTDLIAESIYVAVSLPARQYEKRIIIASIGAWFAEGRATIASID